MRIAARKKIQRAGLGATAAVVLWTATGCSATNPAVTADVDYSPADGIVVQMGEVGLANVLIVATAAQEEGRLLGAIANGGSDDVTVTVETDVASVAIEVPAGETVQLKKIEPVILNPAGTDPGLMIETEFTAAGETVLDTVSVLDHTFPRYAEFIPAAAPTAAINTPNIPALLEDEADEGAGEVG